MNLTQITIKPKQPDEPFVNGENELGFNITDFWKWNLSDLIGNTNRGVLAEFIVKQALNIKSKTRLEWDAFDLETDDGIKIEIKSSAYIQVWKQNEFSKITFGIAPTKTLLGDNTYSTDFKRQADVYVFCLLHHKEQASLNPMDLKQWTFYVLKTETLNKKSETQKTITLSAIEALEHKKCNYNELKNAFNSFTKNLNT